MTEQDTPDADRMAPAEYEAEVVRRMRQRLQELQDASATGSCADQLGAFSAALDQALCRWPEIDELYSY